MALTFSAGVAKVAHLGPFADDVIRASDTVAMSSMAFRDNYQAMKGGTFAEQQAVDVACAFFSSMAQDGVPPAEWTNFETALADRVGVTDSSKYLDGKVGRLELAIDLVEINPRAAYEYARVCLF